ncbi:hypothetical protein VTN77DRAFT_9911 [Rasamsonia byssochlamydoides]|uniref:uncharacterized protein n=1 Tax=Rasamsonia byssochlamydoides TaxID=89139 RepID=UPI003743DD9F
MALSGHYNLNEILVSPAYGTTFLVLIQVISRALTFASNQIVLRHLSPEILGVATQLELYSITVLYFSRECLRTVIQREPPIHSTTVAIGSKTSKDHSAGNSSFTDPIFDSVAAQTVINVSYISLALGFPLVVLFALCYLYLATEEISRTPFFQTSLEIIGLSCLFELATEPFFAVVQQRMLYRTRAAVETSAAVAKSFTVCGISIWAAWAGWNVGVLPFALGYLAYSFALICGYIWKMARKSPEKNFSFLLTPIHSRNGSQYLANRFSRRLIWLGANVYLQLIVKHLLTQGDSMIVAALSSLEDQGIYSLASNYGGLVARILFQPIEESSRNLFARLLNSGGPKNGDTDGVNVAKSHLIDILRAYGILTALTFTIGPSVVPFVIRILIGSRWMSPKVESLLSAYCYYIPFLAFNGITEAFVSSAGNASDMRKQAAWMGAFSACFAAVSFLLLRLGGWGAFGLVWANIINMSIRTIWSYLFIKKYLRQHENDMSISEISLERQTYGICALTFSIMSAIHQSSEKNLHDTIIILGVGAACALLILYSERQYLIKQCSKILKVTTNR